MIVAGSNSQVLASEVARESGMELAKVEYDRFPDGEGIVRVPGLDGRAVIVASTPDDAAYIELLQLIDACSSAEQVDLVIPYMGYARQDKKFEEGQPISARAVARAVSRGVDTVTTVNIHEDIVFNWFEGETKDLNAAGLIGEHLANQVSEPVVLAPDAGATHLADSAQDKLGGETDYLEKTRRTGDEIAIKPKELSVEDREVVIIDDMISTGGTMSKTIELLKEQGAESIYAACIHPVLSKNAVVRLYSSGVEEVVATDTLETALSDVSVAGLIADSL